MGLADILLVLLALGFAWSMGAHYTGACMGMPHAIVAGGRLATPAAIAVIAAAFALTTLFTRLRIPTSTIQILVFCIVGAGAALGLRIEWETIAHLALLWVLAPVAAFGLGYALTRMFDALPGLRAGAGALGGLGLSARGM